MIKFNKNDYADVINKYTDDGTKYCLDVLEGRILAGELIQLACLRQLNDLKRIGQPDFPFVYNLKKVNGILNFANLIPDVNGNDNFYIAKFQKFIYCMVWAWDNIATGGSRFKLNYVSMARTNGKTQMAATFVLLEFLMGYPRLSRQIVIASNTDKQVKQLYGYIRNTGWRNLKENKIFKVFKDLVVANTQEMRIDEENTRLIKMSAESRVGGDSVHPSLIVFDEYHEQKTTDFLDSLTSGNVQNTKARTLIISTAGTDPRVPMREDYSAYSDLLRKGNLNDEILFLCWEQDEDKEYLKPETWIKSNPLMEIPSLKKALTAGVNSALKISIANGSLNKSLVKNLNRWQNAKKNAYIELKDIDSAIIDNFNLYNREVYLGYDSSVSNDDTSLVGLIPYYNNGKLKFHIWQHSWIPTKRAGGIEAKMKRDAINYEKAEQLGFADISKNQWGTVDQDNVFRYLMSTVEQFNWKVRGFGFDNQAANGFIRTLNELNDEWQLFSIKQGAISLSEPTKWVQEQFIKNNITMLDDPILKAGLSNAILKDKDNLLLVDKNTNSAKIDVVDALIDAAYKGMLHDTGQLRPEEIKKEDKKNPFAGMATDEIRQHFMSDNLFG